MSARPRGWYMQDVLLTNKSFYRNDILSHVVTDSYWTYTMDESSLSDDKGNVIQFKLYQGRKFHPGMVGKPSQRVENIISFKSRPDDVLLCTYPKSGTHWVFNIIKMLRSNSIEYRGSPDTLEYEDLADMDLKDSPRTYHSHMTYPLIPEAAQQQAV
ncbi:sulfotransferase 1C2-like [Mizuhopecten yessoensis]|uniref:sulfotransferase 1C2-like n=1 Tax=Mizuhopecten yessoensis TaxID=6573 RepID=UPI000B45E8DA|nr:sulfotransferase 1C2-like [Mizuhopecten yessoensis]